MKNKKILIVILAMLVIVVIIGVIMGNKKANRETTNKEVMVVPTMSDEITADSSWCGTFQLVWNDLKNEVVKKEIIFLPQLEMVRNLNKEEFNSSMLSQDYYFKIYGLKSLELKEIIEKGNK